MYLYNYSVYIIIITRNDIECVQIHVQNKDRGVSFNNYISAHIYRELLFIITRQYEIISVYYNYIRTEFIVLGIRMEFIVFGNYPAMCSCAN